MEFRKRYDENYDPKKNYVVMDDETLTEQQGYKTTTELYEEMVRSGKLLAAHRLGMSYEEFIKHEDEAPFELRYEMDIVEQEEIVNDYKQRLKNAINERLTAEAKTRTSGGNNSPEFENKTPEKTTEINTNNDT